MTEQDAAKLAQVRMGDRVEYRDHGAVVSGQVVGWTSEHSGIGVMMLVYGDYHSDRRVQRHSVLSRTRPGVGVVRFSQG